MMKKRLQENEPLVSVVMPCYNDGPYIEEAVDSLRKQTWTNLELIIIDDGSDDGETVQMIEQTPFPRKKILHTSHIGPAAARNKGISEAEGGFILPLDADDTIDETYIQKAMTSAITALQVKLTKQGNSLQIDLPEVQFPRRSPNIEGSSGIMQELEYGAFYKTNALNTSIQFTLINETASYEVVSA